MSIRTVRKNTIVVSAADGLARFLLVGLLIFMLVPAGLAHADTLVCDPITVDTTWSPEGNNYVVTCILHVVEGATLTIEPGVRVHFEAGCGLRIDGGLIADGVTFVSNQVSPAPGDWSRIYFGPESNDAVFDGSGQYLSGSKIQGSTIVYGGGGADVAGSIIIDGASPLLDDNIVRFSSTRGIWALGRSSINRVVIRGNSVIDNHGGGVYVSAGELDQNVISHNDNGMFGSGAGVYAVNSVLTGNEVTLNRSGSGAGIYALDSTLSNNTVSANSTVLCVNPYGVPCFPVNPTRHGGGIYSNGSDLIGNTVSGNSIGNHYDDQAFGGGIYAVGGTLSGNTVTGNVITQGGSRGGGIYSSLSTVTDNVIEDNSVSGHNSSGGGIYITGGGVANNTVSGNTVTCAEDEISYGGGIYADGGVIMNNLLANNAAAGGVDSQGGGVYGAVNTISGNTLSGNSARRGAAVYSNNGTVSNNSITGNTAAWSGSIYMYQGTAMGNTVEGNSAVNGGGLVGFRAVLVGNIVQNNTANVGGGIASSEGTVRGNTVTGNIAQSEGGGIYAEQGTVTENTVTGNGIPSYGHGSGAYLLGAVDFTYNSVTGNTASGGTAGGITINGQPLVQFNNLYDNEPYDVEVISADPVTATLNFWGESLCTEIAWQIYDGHDLPGRGDLLYAPSLYSPVPVTQLDAPTGLALDIDQEPSTLSWTPIESIPVFGCRPPGYTDPDQGYSIYYSIGEPCGPYRELVDVGNVTSYELSQQGLGGYYLVVAAWDYLERQSAFSNPVVVPPPDMYPIYLPVVMRVA